MAGVGALAAAGLYGLAVPLACASPAGVRVATYNIQHGVGPLELLDLEATVNTLQAAQADVVLLQEVDSHFGPRGGWQDQPALLAEALDMQVVYAPTVVRERPGLPAREYGIATLTSLPILSSEILPLPGEAGAEPRVALRVVVETDRGPLVTVTTHLAHENHQLRVEQSQALGEHLRPVRDPTVVGADLNAVPGSRVLDARPEPFNLVQAGATCTPVLLDDDATDYLLVAGALAVLGHEAFETDNSDHRLLYVDVALERTDNVEQAESALLTYS